MSGFRNQEKPLYDWCISNRCIMKANDERVRTHILMDGFCGGKLHVTDSQSPEFLDRYAADCEQGVGHYVVENRTPVFRLPGDIDVERKSELNDASILAYCKGYQEAAKKFYPDLNAGEIHKTFQMVIARTEARVYSGRPLDLNVKTGIRFIFPNLLVDQHRSLIIRAASISNWRSVYGDLVGEQNEWEKVLDPCIYEGNGLRLVLSRKVEKCMDCQNDPEKRKECFACRFRGKIDIGRVYRCWKVIHGDGTEDHLTAERFKSNAYSFVGACHIRRPEGTTLTPGWKIYDGAPVVPVRGLQKVLEVVDKVSGKPRVAFREDMKSLSRMYGKVEIDRTLQPEVYQIIQNHIRKHSGLSIYQNVHVSKVYTNKRSGWYKAEVKGEGSAYCQNIGKDHIHNHIYFQFSPRGMSQKCHCQCETTIGRRFGLCKKFSSTLTPLTNELNDLLFPTAHTKATAFFSDRSEWKSCSDTLEHKVSKIIADHLSRFVEFDQKVAKGWNGTTVEDPADDAANEPTQPAGRYNNTHKRKRFATLQPHMRKRAKTSTAPPDHPVEDIFYDEFGNESP